MVWKVLKRKGPDLALKRSELLTSRNLEIHSPQQPKLVRLLVRTGMVPVLLYHAAIAEVEAAEALSEPNDLGRTVSVLRKLAIAEVLA
jgi:hypothetical protein